MCWNYAVLVPPHPASSAARPAPAEGSPDEPTPAEAECVRANVRWIITELLDVHAQKKDVLSGVRPPRGAAA